MVEAANEIEEFNKNPEAYKRKHKLRRGNSSGIEGVSFHKGKNKWVARMRAYGKEIHIGTFLTKEDAVRALNIAKSLG